MKFHRMRILGLRRLVADILLSEMAFCTVSLVPLIPSIGLARLLRLDSLWTHLGFYFFAAALAQIMGRTYRMIWRYVSFRDVLALIRAATFTVMIFAVLEFIAFGETLAKSALIFSCTLLFLWVANVVFLAAPRMLARALVGPRLRSFRVAGLKSIPVLVTGDLARVESFVRGCRGDDASHYNIVGVLTDDYSLHGSYLDGVEVLGAPSQIKPVLSLLHQSLRAEDMPTTLVFARDDATHADFEHLLQLTASTGLKVGRLPRQRVLQEKAPSAVEPIALSDLLGRPELVADTKSISAMVQDKCVLVTGAGGSIGSELTRQIAQMRPKQLIVLDFSEFNLYAIDKELQENYPDLDRVTLLVDVRDEMLVSHWLKTFCPDIVFHAAALKHVPLVEDHPIEGMKTNVLGTINLAEACCANGIQAMVTISTDKAVNPCNVMGATKRLAEAYCQGLDQSADAHAVTRFITVRFGNVLGSAGSVVPLFQRQIEAGGPVTVTHQNITRFFMTIPEAVSLVLQAGAQGINMDGERGSIYVLDMGRPVRIIDLARQMIRLSGRLPDVDVKIEIIGLRPGEKLYEEVAYDDEVTLPTASKTIMRLKPRTTDLRILRQQVQEMRQSCLSGDRDRALRILGLSVPEYSADTGPSHKPRLSDS